MQCRSCHAEIADKAIVCYRCGTPTAIPDTPAAATPARSISWLPVFIVLALIALAVWLIPMTRPGSLARIGAWVATWVIAFAVVAWFRGRRRR